jgi:hypothetical protein
MTRRLLVLFVPALLLTACGGGSSPTSDGLPTIAAAKQFTLTHFTPSTPIATGKPVRVSFVIQQPNGKPLTQFKRGAGPHTGVHLIIVRRDLATIIHTHPPIAPDGTIATTVTFTKPGPYRVVVDAYPKNALEPNFQLFTSLRVAGTYTPKKLPSYSPTDKVDGYTITLLGKPNLHAIQADYLHATVTAPNGTPATFTPWFGALAHAIFFRDGTLDYFHTHICSPSETACAAAVGSTRISGKSSTPGKLTIGVLVPEAGTWELFLQCRVDGRILTAPFTLDVKP